MGHARRAREIPPTTGIDATMAYAMPTIAATCTAQNGARTITVRPAPTSPATITLNVAPIHKTPAVIMVTPLPARLPRTGLLARLVRIPRQEILARLVRICNMENAMNGARTIPVLPGSLFTLHSRTATVQVH